MKLRLIGDIHGKFLSQYAYIIANCHHSIQIGDFGFDEAWLWYKSNGDHQHHLILPGNHDDYDCIAYFNIPHLEYGPYMLGDFKFFAVRGAASVDAKWCTLGVDWWTNEQLSHADMNKVLDLYQHNLSDIMITHDCPKFVSSTVFGIFDKNDATAKLFDEMYTIHQPKLWVFGHHHKNVVYKHNDTYFVCLGEHTYWDYNTELSVEENVNSFKQRNKIS